MGFGFRFVLRFGVTVRVRVRIGPRLRVRVGRGQAVRQPAVSDEGLGHQGQGQATHRTNVRRPRRWEAVAGGIGGRAHLHGVADDMGLLCMPASRGGAMCVGRREPGRAGEVSVRQAQEFVGLWFAQQVAQQARSRRALCRVGRRQRTQSAGLR